MFSLIIKKKKKTMLEGKDGGKATSAPNSQIFVNW